MIQIIAVKFENGYKYQNIIEYKWMNLSNDRSGTATQPGMVEFVNNNPRNVFVTDLKGDREVFVVNAKKPYLRTKAEKGYTDNLLNLPTY